MPPNLYCDKPPAGFYVISSRVDVGEVTVAGSDDLVYTPVLDGTETVFL